MNVVELRALVCDVPRPRLHLGLAVDVVAAQFGQAVLDVAPAAGQLAGQLDGRAGDLAAAAAVAEERPFGQGPLRARALHVGDGATDVAGALLGHDDGGLDFSDGAGLLDGGALADA